jgi:hypothetical protein
MYDMYGPEGIEARKREYVGLMVDDDIASGVSPGSRVEYTAQEQSDMATGKRTPADIMRERGVVDKTRDELVADKIAELDDQYQREFGDRNAWIADEMLSEYWRSYGNEIDINKLRGSKSPFDRARAAEGVSVFNQRLLGLLGMKFDPQTGKPLTIPSQLFRDNPLIDTPVIRRRVNETVRLYDQYLQGLEDAGAVDAPGTPLPKTDNPNDYARDSRVVMPEDPATGVRDDDFAVVGPDGGARFRSPDEIKEIERTRAAQVADMASRESGREAAGGEFGLHTDPSGRKILRGDKLPDSFYLLKSFPEHAKAFSRQLDEVQDRGGVVEVTFNRVGEKNDGGSWKPTANRSAAESVTRRMIPFGRQVSKTNQILAEFLDLDAVNAAAMKMINNNELPAFNNNLGQLTADLKTYLANHRAGRPGETGLTIEKRNILNALVGTGTAVQRKANPLVGSVNARGAVRTVRLDRIVRLKDTAEDGLGFDNDRVKGNRMPDAEPVPEGMPERENSNRMPQQIPREAQGMPDAVDALTTDQLQRQYEENQGYLGLSTLGMREGRPVRGGAAQTRELLRRNEAISAELQRRGVREEDPQLQRALQRRGQAMPDAALADAPPFYMKSAQVLDSKIQGKAATVDQVRAILTNPQNGIKAEELKWTGVLQAAERLAKENNGKVPKDALLKYLADDGAVRLEEVRMGAQGEQLRKQLRVASNELNQQMIMSGLPQKAMALGMSQLDAANLPANLVEGKISVDNLPAPLRLDAQKYIETNQRYTELMRQAKDVPEPRYAQWQLPGGQNYREVVLAMPQRPEPAQGHYISKSGQYYMVYDGRAAIGEFLSIEDAQAFLRSKLGTDNLTPQNFKSTHYGTPNYVAHMRLNERVDDAGRAGLFIEELQSDRHQKGREAGYQEDAARTERQIIRDLDAVTEDLRGRGAKYAPSEQDWDNNPDLLARHNALSAELDAARIKKAEGELVPDAPFRKDWALQLFKRALRDAVAEEKEWIGWTVGETQASRYDLSKKVSSVRYFANKDGTYNLLVYGLENIDEPIIDSVSVTQKELSNIIGKDLARQAAEGKGDNFGFSGWKGWEGSDLKIGGDGMRAFYDNIVPNEISKYVRQWGGKAEKASVDTGKKGGITVENYKGMWVVRENGEVVTMAETKGAAMELAESRGQINTGNAPIWRVNITPQMREGIKKAGQALFVGGAAAVVAEDQLEQ